MYDCKCYDNTLRLQSTSPLVTMKQRITVSQYEQLQEEFDFKNQQYDSVNCYHSPLYYNNPLYFNPLSYEVIDNDHR